MTSPAGRGTTAAADLRIPARHPFAAHLRRAADAERASAHRLWTPDDEPLPSLYISHGAPMLFEMTGWMTELHSWARALPKPKGILVVSAHWESAPLSLSSRQPRELVYDFGGFDPMYYQMRYDIPAATELTRQVSALMPDTEVLSAPASLARARWKRHQWNIGVVRATPMVHCRRLARARTGTAGMLVGLMWRFGLLRSA